MLTDWLNLFGTRYSFLRDKMLSFCPAKKPNKLHLRYWQYDWKFKILTVWLEEWCHEKKSNPTAIRSHIFGEIKFAQSGTFGPFHNREGSCNFTLTNNFTYKKTPMNRLCERIRAHNGDVRYDQSTTGSCIVMWFWIYAIRIGSPRDRFIYLV